MGRIDLFDGRGDRAACKGHSPQREEEVGAKNLMASDVFGNENVLPELNDLSIG